jgi:hypothetical protein
MAFDVESSLSDSYDRENSKNAWSSFKIMDWKNSKR